MSGVVVLAGDLVGVLAGLVPHLASVPRDPDGGPGGAGLGEGVARLVLVDGECPCLLGLAVGRRRGRACVVYADVVSLDEGVVLDVWLARPEVSQVVAVLRGCAPGAGVVLEASSRCLRVREEGVLWGGRSLVVPVLGPPEGRGRVDAARVLLPLAGLPLAASATAVLPLGDVRAFTVTARAVDQPLCVRVGGGTGTGTVAWGCGPGPEGGTRYLGWSLAPSGARVPEAADPLYRGPLTGWLARAALPDPAADPGGEAEVTRLAREVEDYLASTRGLDGPDTTTTTT